MSLRNLQDIQSSPPVSGGTWPRTGSRFCSPISWLTAQNQNAVMSLCSVFANAEREMQAVGELWSALSLLFIFLLFLLCFWTALHYKEQSVILVIQDLLSTQFKIHLCNDLFILWRQRGKEAENKILSTNWLCIHKLQPAPCLNDLALAEP